MSIYTNSGLTHNIISFGLSVHGVVLVFVAINEKSIVTVLDVSDLTKIFTYYKSNTDR